jgi:3-deoxy-7-phosphoheptulonate synthase
MKLQNLNIESIKVLVTPEAVKNRLPMTAAALKTVQKGRASVRDILDGRDHRLMIVVGPCSIHDPKAALEYAGRLKSLAGEVSDTLFVIMRVYFEKPRTTIGWKGYVNDPRMDDSFKIEEGLIGARRMLLDFNNLGLPCGTEALDPIAPQYLSDLISWSAIGARTTESQTHREMASGLSMAVGFKNSTDGGLQAALGAMRSALNPHHFLGITQQGVSAVFNTKGNRYGHLVLRGGGGRQNSDPRSVRQARQALKRENLRQAILVDCSHANSNKDYRVQPNVMANVVRQIRHGDPSIVGAMIESNLYAGNQPIPKNLKDLKYGVSVTDACVDWPTTVKMLKTARASLKGFKRTLKVKP